jgi:DNA repair exonuclease SbcCD ATPase subunit
MVGIEATEKGFQFLEDILGRKVFVKYARNGPQMGCLESPENKIPTKLNGYELKRNFLMTIEEIVKEFSEIKGREKQLQKTLSDKLDTILDLKESATNQSDARWVLTEVSQLTQSRFKSKVEALVTMAIQSVFDRPFEFFLEFERKRNKMECRPIVKELVNGKYREFDPEEDMGGGIIDIISFAFRIVLWNLENPSSRNAIVLDEPMKNMGKLIVLGGQVLKEISHKLNFQVILITHDEELIEIADRSYQVSHDGNKSVVKLVKGGVIEEQKRQKIAR